MLCSIALIPASSGKPEKYRFNYEGDRNADSVPRIIAVNRPRCNGRMERNAEERQNRRALSHQEPYSSKRPSSECPISSRCYAHVHRPSPSR
jgi:hypothetical protein